MVQSFTHLIDVTGFKILLNCECMTKTMESSLFVFVYTNLLTGICELLRNLTLECYQLATFGYMLISCLLYCIPSSVRLDSCLTVKMISSLSCLVILLPSLPVHLLHFLSSSISCLSCLTVKLLPPLSYLDKNLLHLLINFTSTQGRLDLLLKIIFDILVLYTC